MEDYKFCIDDFDLDKIKDYQTEKIIESSNFRTVIGACQDTLRYSRMTAIIGEPGFGKTKALEYFANNNKNVYYIVVKKSMTPKSLYNTILQTAGWSNAYKESTLYHIIESIGYYLSQSTSKNLLIIDEAGKLSHRNLLYLHDLRDSVLKNTGIIIAGPKYFQTTLLSLEKKRIEGIQELMRRINIWIELQETLAAEKREICKIYGITDSSLIRFIVANSYHLGDVYNYIFNFGLLVSRYNDK